MFFYLCKVLFLGFLQLNGDFVDAQSNSKYRDWAPSSCLMSVVGPYNFGPYETKLSQGLNYWITVI